MAERCPFCGQASEMLWVRAHYQCAACGQVVVPCCNGETACVFPHESGSLKPRSLRSGRQTADTDVVTREGA